MPPDEICLTCHWYVARGRSRGQCRRRAPRAHGWPLVWPSDGCGEHLLGDTLAPPPKPQPLPALDPDGDGFSGPLHDPTHCRFCQDEETAVPFAPE